MAETSRPPTPLGRLMDDRRTELDLTWREVALSAGITTETLRGVRFGEQGPLVLTQSAIDRALRWEKGAVGRFLEDGTLPVPLPSEPSSEMDEAWAAKILFPDDPVAQAIIVQPGKPREVVRGELGDWLVRQAHAAQA